jgi:hypothetical protein
VHDRDQQRRQVFERTARLNLQDQRQAGPVERLQMSLQHAQVVGRSHERIADDIGVGSDERKILEILCCQRRHSHRAVRHVDAFVGAKGQAGGVGVRNCHLDLGGADVPDHSADAAVIEPHGLAWLDLVQRLGQRDADPRRRQHRSILVADGWAAGIRILRKDQRVAHGEFD